MSAGLVIRDAAVRAGTTTLLRPTSLDAPPGVVFSVMGPSGVGKSTLINHIVGALPARLSRSGAIWLDGARIDQLPIERRRIGVVFQDPMLFPHLSVGANLAFALPAARGEGRGAARRRSRRAICERALKEAELAGFFERDPATLSGGQAARIALMRALLAEPRALLLDEPFSKLDAELRARVRAFTFEAARMRGLPVLLVTHDRADVEAAGGPVLLLDGGDEEAA